MIDLSDEKAPYVGQQRLIPIAFDAPKECWDAIDWLLARGWVVNESIGLLPMDTQGNCVIVLRYAGVIAA